MQGIASTSARMDKPAAEEKNQLDFYAHQAADYLIQPFGQGEVDPALPFLVGQIRMRGWKSLLDVGSGGGRVPAIIRDHTQLERIVGLEPSEGLRKVAHEKYGFAASEFIAGDATVLPFADNEFDIVTEFAVLHHMRQPRRAITEMIRVARHAVAISDSNNFGQGRYAARRIKQLLHAVKLWPLVDFIRSGGKGYHISKDDGLWYSYSVFNDIDLLRDAFHTVHVVNLVGAAANHYNDSGGALLIGIGKKSSG